MSPEAAPEIGEGDVFVIQPYHFQGHLFARQFNKSSWAPKEQIQVLVKVSEKDFGLGMVLQPSEEFLHQLQKQHGKTCWLTWETKIGWGRYFT